MQATEGGAGASTCAAPSAAWVAGLRSELRAELYRELSRETGCELKRMAQEMAAMRSAFEGQARPHLRAPSHQMIDSPILLCAESLGDAHRVVWLQMWACLSHIASVTFVDFCCSGRRCTTHASALTARRREPWLWYSCLLVLNSLITLRPDCGAVLRPGGSQELPDAAVRRHSAWPRA